MAICGFLLEVRYPIQRLNYQKDMGTGKRTNVAAMGISSKRGKLSGVTRIKMGVGGSC